MPFENGNFNIENHDFWLPEQEALFSQVVRSEHARLIEARCAWFYAEYSPALCRRSLFGTRVDVLAYLVPFVRLLITQCASESCFLDTLPAPLDPCIAHESSPVELLQTRVITELVAAVPIGSSPSDRESSSEGSGSPSSVDGVMVSDSDKGDPILVDDDKDGASRISDNYSDRSASVDSGGMSYRSNASSWFRQLERRQLLPDAPSTHSEEKEQRNIEDPYLLADLTCHPDDCLDDLISFLSLSLAHNFAKVVTSCVYHRHVWNIGDAPFLGLSFDESTHTVYAAFAHVDRGPSASLCPRIHFCNNPRAKFNLAEPGDLKRLGSLIVHHVVRNQDLAAAVAPSESVLRAIDAAQTPVWRVDVAQFMSTSGRLEKKSLACVVHRWLASITGTILTDSPLEDSTASRSTPKSTLVSGSIGHGSAQAAFGPMSASLMAAGGRYAKQDYAIQWMRLWRTSNLATLHDVPDKAMLQALEAAGRLDAFLKDKRYIGLSIGRRYHEYCEFACPELASIPELYREHSLVKAGLAAKKRYAQTPFCKTFDEDPVVQSIFLDALPMLCNVFDEVTKLDHRGISQANEAVSRRIVDRLIDHFHNASADKPLQTLWETNLSEDTVLLTFHENDIALSLSDLVDADKFKLYRVRKILSGDLEFEEEDREGPMDTWATQCHGDQEWVEKRHTFRQIAIDKQGPHFILDPGERLRHFENEPTSATCDSVSAICLPNIFASNDISEAFNFLSPPSGSHELPDPQKIQSERTTVGLLTDEHLDPFKGSHNVVGTAAAQDAMVAQSSESAADQAHAPSISDSNSKAANKPSLPAFDLWKSLFVPVVTVEDKRASGNAMQAMHLNQLYGGAGAKFLAALKLFDLELYGLIVKGLDVLVTATYAEEWKDDAKDPEDRVERDHINVSKVRIMDRHATSFNLRNGADFINFALFLIRVRVLHVPLMLAGLRRGKKADGDQAGYMREKLKDSIDFLSRTGACAAPWRKARRDAQASKDVD